MRPVKQTIRRMSEWQTRLPIAIKRVLVMLTRQPVVVQAEVCEFSQLTQLGWDATCEVSRAVSE